MAEAIDRSIVTMTVKVDGTAIDDTIEVVSIHVEKTMNKIASAKLSLEEGFNCSGINGSNLTEVFAPNSKVTIMVGYDSKDTTIFEGVITGQALKSDPSSGMKLDVDCMDPATKMVSERKTQTYKDMKDSEVITNILGDYSGLKKEVTDTINKMPIQVQYSATDWDFIVTLAEANGLIVTTIDGKVSVVKPNADKTSVFTAEYEKNLIEINTQLDALSQLGTVKASAWDFKNQKMISASVKTDSKDATGDDLAAVANSSDYELQSSAPLTEPELKRWAEAQAVKSDYSKIQGDVKIKGTAVIQPGNYITLANVGKEYNGDHLVSKIVHTVQGGDWTVEAGLGLPSTWMNEKDSGSSNLNAPIKGIFSGIVKQVYDDPDSQYRILTEIPLLGDKSDPIWARLTNFYSTKNAGAFFLPEEGDEVIVSFLNEDPRFPIIMGSMYSSPNHKPFKGLDPAEKNPKKAIVSKSGLFIEFNDEDKIFTIETPNKNTVILSDKDDKITLLDKNKNKVELSSSGILIDSAKDITMKAKGKIDITATNNITAKSSAGDVTIQGKNVTGKANMALKMEGGMSGEVKGGLSLKLNAAMININ